MINNTARLILFFCGGLLFFGCSSAKKSKVLRQAQAQTAVVRPSEIVENSISKLDTVLSAAPILTATQVSTSLQVTDPDLTPEQQAWNQMLLGIDKSYDYASAMHFDVRKPSFVMIHHTSQNSVAQTIRTFQLAHTKVSSHYVIGKDGQVVQMLNDYLRSWHAGRGRWGNITDMNSVSIGIELDNNGSETFPEEQINSLLTLLDSLKSKYRIPQKNFIGHSDFAPSRKNDPNVFFPWQILAEKGFGIWYNPDFLPTPPANFNPIDALKLMGYDTSNLQATIVAFKRKFIRRDLKGTLTDYDKAVLFDLYRKFY